MTSKFSWMIGCHLNLSADIMNMLVYVGGYSRSGSTISDVILGNHPSIFSAGELCFLPEDWIAKDRKCTCGQKYHECAFWKGLNLSKSKAEEWTDTLRAVESRSRFSSLVKGRLEPELIERYRAVNRTILEYIRNTSGKPIILDSSKNARCAAGRALALQRYCDEDVYFIHALRHPFSVINSYRKRGSNWAAEGHGGEKRLPGARAMVGWKKANAIAMKTGRILGKNRYFCHKHEDVITDPSKQFEKVGNFLDLDLSDLVEKIEADASFATGHNVGGNRLRKSNQVKLRKAETTSIEKVPLGLNLLFGAYGSQLCEELGYTRN